ncbi:hypothetical protein EXS57_03460 [Candidatus Kaiserbacteria bacterium]|nr:hypothetical protein [Candidatus Kaiserbacteria bacterium]
MSAEGSQKNKGALKAIEVSNEMPIETSSLEQNPAKDLTKAELKEKLRAVIVNMDQLAEQAARDSAERSLTASAESMAGVSGFFKRIWTHTLAREYYRQKHVSQARETIHENQNIHAAELDHPTGKEEHDATAQTLVERFTQDYEETLHKGETRSVINREGADGLNIKGEIISLMKEYATGKIRDDDFNEAKKQILHTVSRVEGSDTNDSMYADNLLEIARNVKAAVNQKEAFEVLDSDLEIILGSARDSIQTEAKHNVVDRAIEFAKKTPFGVLVNESTLASGIAIAAGVMTGVSKRLTSSRLAAWGTFGATAALTGGIIGYAENKRTKEDRAQHQREMAQGRAFERGSAPRREEMDNFVHEMREASHLSSTIREAATPEAKINAIADAEARIRLMDRENIDLLSYSDPTKVEQERFDLDMARGQAKAELRKISTMGGDFDEELKKLVDARMHGLTHGEGGIEERDRLFNKMKNKRVASAAAKGVLIGLTVGTVAQEAAAFFNDEQTGLVEHLVKGSGADGANNNLAIHMTWLESLRHYVSGGGGSTGGGPVTEQISTTVSANEYLKDHKLGTRISRVGWYDQNTPKPVIDKNELRKLGTRISRVGWYDQNTPKPVIDKNELRLTLGGIKGTGIDAKGNYVFSMKSMTPGDSFHKGLSANAQELLKEGKLKMLLSMSLGTQAHPIGVPLDPNGTISIDPNSEIGKLLFAQEGGKAKFLGRFMEVAEVTGTKDNVDHFRILATHEGKGVGQLTDLIQREVPAPSRDLITDLPPIIPIYGRTPFEPLGKNRKDIPPKNPLMGYPYGGFGSTEGLWKEMEKMKVKLDTYAEKIIDGQKVWVDGEGYPVHRDVEREQKRVRAYLEMQEKDYIDELNKLAAQISPMNEKCRVSVIIPANFEEKYLDNLLTQYTKQNNEEGGELDKDSFEINIIINRKVGKPSDASVEVIEEWKKNNPGYHVNVIDVEFPPEKANVGTARKYITDLSLLRSIERKQTAGPLYIESEDADLFSIDKRTIAKITQDFDKKPHLDILRGVQDRQPEVLQRNDMLFFDRRLSDIAEVFMRKTAYRPERMKGSSFMWNRVISGGWNTAFTAESYAQIGGYVSDVAGEDMKIGWKTSLIRGHAGDNGTYIPNTMTAAPSGLRSNSSPRRFIDAMIRRAGAYDNFGSDYDEKMKKLSLDDLLEGVKEDAKAEIGAKSKYEDAINRLKGFLREQIKEPESQHVFERTLWAMGLRKSTDFTIAEGGFVKLTDNAMPQIISLLERYKTEKRHEWGYRRQNNPLNIGPSAPKPPEPAPAGEPAVIAA